MILRVKNKEFDLFNQVSVNLAYDSVGSVFSLTLYCDPDNREQMDIFKPFTFPEIVLEHNGERLITGTILSNRAISAAEQSLIQVSGYSTPGILEDSSIPKSCYPLQSNNLTIKQLAEKLAKPFGISVVVEATVSDVVNRAIPVTIAGENQSVKDYLTEVSASRNVILSHDEMGNLLLRSANTKASPVFDFTTGRPGTTFELVTNGQAVHDEITVSKQPTLRGKGNSGQAVVKNPYCPIFKPKIDKQSSGEVLDAKKAVRNALSEELKDAIGIDITLDRWDVNDRIIRPGSIVTITNPALWIYEKARLFVHSVDFVGDPEAQTCVLHCSLPEVYNNEDPKNIFN